MTASPNSRPATNWRRSTASGAAQRAASGRGGVAPAPRLVEPGSSSWAVGIRADRQADREHRQPDRDDVGLVPGRRELGRVPEHRPEGEEDRRRQRATGGGSRSRPSIHQQMADVDGRRGP